MTDQPSDRPVRVTGEERLHPALRKVGRACIALARWQREQETTSGETVTAPRPAEQTATTNTATPSTTATQKTAAADQERRHD